MHDEALTPTHTEAQQKFKNDRLRIRGRKAALYALLSDGAWHPNYECAQVGGLSFNAHLYQLRREGWEIQSRHASGGVWEQRLTGKREVEAPLSTLSGPQRCVLGEFAMAVRKVYGTTGLAQIRRYLPDRLADEVQI